MFSVDQKEQEGEEGLDDKQSPVLPGLISRVAATLNVETPLEQGLTQLCFEDNKGRSWPSLRFLVSFLPDF